MTKPIPRALCATCGRATLMIEAEFCADCGLLIGPECFAAYCEHCCQPRCPHCARTEREVCAACAGNGVASGGGARRRGVAGEPVALPAPRTRAAAAR